MISRLATAAVILLLIATANLTAPASAGVGARGQIAGSKHVTVISNGSWTTYHHDNAHTGYDPAAPTMTSAIATPGWTEAALDGEVYAEPLIFNNVVYVTTLNNTVYALNQANGAVLWSKNVGTPVSTGWQCGGFTQGILGTGVIDATTNRIYVATILNSDHAYRVFGLDLANNGSVVLETVLAISGFTWQNQQQRGALSLANSSVYVPIGGRAGDCGAYHGYVVGVPTNGSPSFSYQVPSTGSSVWAAGGLAVDDTTGNVFAATGNGVGSGCTAVNQNDAVVRLSPALSLQDWFMPNDWQNNWCSNDQDLGSAGPLLISPTLLFQSGKWGGAFLLNPNSLGGVDGQRFPTPKPAAYSQAEACLGNHSNATFGSFAYAAPFVFLQCQGLGVVALKVDASVPSAPTFTPCDATCPAPDWHAGGSTTFGPPIVAGGAVWAASDGGGLYAFNATTGVQIFHSAGFGTNHFVTPAEAGGQVFVPSHTVIKSFTFGGSVSLVPQSLDFTAQAPNTTSAAQLVTLHNNQPIALHVAAAAITGANAGQYVKGTDTCSTQTIAAGGTCTVQVSFRPTGIGGFPASLAFTDDGPGSPQTAPLNGLGAIDNQGHLYTLDGYGGLHADGGAPALASASYWPGWNIARSVALFPDGLGGYLMDGYGGLHEVGNATPLSGFGYWAGYDIARQVVLAPWSSKSKPVGWTLDGLGGVTPFGNAPSVGPTSRWNWDIARSLVILPDSTPGSVAGYTLDGYGGIHPFGGAPAVSNNSYWGWDIARGISLSPAASRTNPAGWTLDGYGGVHAFGSAPDYSNYTRWGWDIGRGIVTWTGPGIGGWVLDGWGGIHPWGNAPDVSGFAYWPGWDIANSLTGANSGTGSRGK